MFTGRPSRLNTLPPSPASPDRAWNSSWPRRPSNWRAFARHSSIRRCFAVIESWRITRSRSTLRLQIHHETAIACIAALALALAKRHVPHVSMSRTESRNRSVRMRDYSVRATGRIRVRCNSHRYSVNNRNRRDERARLPPQGVLRISECEISAAYVFWGKLYRKISRRFSILSEKEDFNYTARRLLIFAKWY